VFFVLQRAVGRCETVHGAECELTLELSAESDLLQREWQVGMNGYLAVIMREH